MMKRRPSREALALLPWVLAALAWFGLVTPMRADQETRLAEQSRIRRDRLKAERGLRETEATRVRIASALEKACGASTDPAALRQRAVAASAGLPLSSFSLTVTGGPEAGATVDATGTGSVALELLRRLGDPGKGGFLRSVTIRDKGGLWTVSATTGVLGGLAGGVMKTPVPCSGIADPPPTEAASAPPSRNARPPRSAGPPVPAPEPVPSTPVIETAPPPITLVAFLLSKGRSRVSVRLGDEIRVMAAGQTLDGWTCVSIDPDEEVVFTSPIYGRVVLRAPPPGR
jgi:hypothetical protein